MSSSINNTAAQGFSSDLLRVKNQATQFMCMSKANYKEAIREAEQDSALRAGHRVWKLSFVTALLLSP